MKYLAVVLSVLLVGCSTVAPVTVKFPEVPAELLETCPDLDKIPPTKQLSTTAEVVIKNYSKYHGCKNKVDMWIEWHKSQKQIFDDVSK